MEVEGGGAVLNRIVFEELEIVVKHGNYGASFFDGKEEGVAGGGGWVGGWVGG